MMSDRALTPSPSMGQTSAPRNEAALPRASIVIPTLNEEHHIGPLLDQLVAHLPGAVSEILVADGGSDDATRRIVESYSRRDPRIVLIENPDRIQAAGVNAAVRASDPRSQVIIRIDAHAQYSDSFVRTLLTEMTRPARDSVVVRLRTEGVTCFQRAVAMVSNSKVGTGGSAHRMGAGSGYVDHGHHAAIRRETFLALGGYDDAFATNEDAEFDQRLTARGGKIWLSGEAEVCYFPRATAAGLAQQYFRYGTGRAQNLIKHQTLPKLRQLVPVFLTLYVMFGVPLAFLLSPLFALPLAAYLALLAGVTAAAVIRHKTLCALGVGIALPVMHLSWGLGFLKRALHDALRRGKAGKNGQGGPQADLMRSASSRTSA